VIGDAFYQASVNNIQYSQVAYTISRIMVTTWDNAWNVFVIKNSNYKHNSVSIGYAFRDHWLWNNDFYHGYSIVLWKDYNCKTWVHVNISP